MEADITTWFHTILLDFDLDTLCSLALSQNSNLALSRAALKVIGLLMSTDDHLMVQAFEKMNKKVHCHLMCIISIEQDAIEEFRGEVASEDDKFELNRHIVSLKEALWALSNLAAGPPYILDELLSGDILKTCIKLA